ncbi:hypothetical protein BB14905_04593 [Bacillus sp. B14905]|nr:hypothetical protein BB14905_04593 [Bacillus sp. B14905]
MTNKCIPSGIMLFINKKIIAKQVMIQVWLRIRVNL